MKIRILSLSVLAFGIIISAGIILDAKTFAQENAGNSNAEVNIQYPIVELGNCKNKEECKNFCEKPEHTNACLAFAQTNNLMSKEEIAAAKKMLSIGKGPGGCTSKDTCEAYCDNTDHINECVAFAEKTGIIPPKDLEEAKKIKAAIDSGIKPPPCKSKKECDSYCGSGADQMEQCITFAKAAGFMKPEEEADAQKMIAAMKKGAKPPACNGKEDCDQYCSQDTHFEECINFAEVAGFITSEEVQMARKTGGKGPGNCRGKEECDSFCQKDANMETCANFAVEHGMMSQKDLEMFKKTGGKGPGGCKSKDECDAFCNNSENREACFSFGKEHGLISEEDLKKMEDGKQKMVEGFNQAPPEVVNCLKQAFGDNNFEKIKSGGFMPTQEMGEHMRECFGKMGPPPGDEKPGEGPGGWPDGGPNSSGTPMMGPGKDDQSGGPNIDSLPSQVKECMILNFGANFEERVKLGEIKGEEFGQQVTKCFVNFQSQQGVPMQNFTMPSGSQMMPLQMNQPLPIQPQQTLPPPPAPTQQPLPSGFVPAKMLLGFLIEAFDNVFQKIGF
ncbi:MAG: hypothetical protein NUV83_02740 [Candidatus Wolfebacteria bacterium]|nr:hypothetical protein [Candidatus Wolfebacteria bacterium]